VRDHGLTLVAVQSLQKTARYENRRVIGGKTDRHGVHRVGIDHTHCRRAYARRYRHLTHDVHHLLLGEPLGLGWS
jgi:hypothetical protein